MRVLVIGGSGYIGSRLVQELIELGIPTTVWDLDPPSESLIGKAEFIQRDFLNVVSSDLAEFDSVVLLAGVSSVRKAQGNPALTVRVNIEGLVRLFSQIGNKLLIYASSGSVYDGCGEHLAGEDSPLSQPRNIYDLSKQVGDEIATIYGHRWLGLRFGTVNGVSQNMRTDLVINHMTLTAHRDGVVEIANPHVHRSILCIDDLARFVSKVVQTQPSEMYSGIVNLASFNTSIGDIGRHVAEYFKVQIKELPPSLTYDFSMLTTKAIAMFGFEPIGTLEKITNSVATKYANSTFPDNFDGSRYRN